MQTLVTKQIERSVKKRLRKLNELNEKMLYHRARMDVFIELKMYDRSIDELNTSNEYLTQFYEVLKSGRKTEVKTA